MTKETLIKSALRALVNGEVKQGSAGYALEEDSAYEVSWKDVLKWLEQQPRHKGKWKEHDTTFGRNIYYCTACGRSLEILYEYDFCPNCGADMRGEEE